MSDNPPQFGKRTVTTTFYEGREVTVGEEMETEHFIPPDERDDNTTVPDNKKLLDGVIDSLSVVTTGKSNKVILEISINKQKRYRITRRYKVV